MCGILAKYVAAFCPCPRNLPVTKFESNGMISLVEKISRQPNVDSVGWLLAVILIQVYNDKRACGIKRSPNHTVKNQKECQEI